MKRTDCPICGRNVALSKGRLYKHGGRNSRRGEIVKSSPCKGTRLTPEQALALKNVAGGER